MTKKMFPFSGRLVILTVLLLSILCFAPTLIAVQAAAQVNIVSHSSYIGPYGYFTVVGEVQNDGDQTARNIEFSATFYNAENEVLGTHEDSSINVPISNLYPDRKSPFSFIFLNATHALEVDHYSLSVDFTSSDVSYPQTLNITSHSSSIVEGHMIISGEIQHMGDSSANLVKVVATCYNESGIVVDTDGQSALSIEPHGTTTFEIDIWSENVPLIDSYVLTAESPFYAIIPEFNSLLLTMLVLSLISISFFLSKRKILQN